MVPFPSFYDSSNGRGTRVFKYAVSARHIHTRQNPILERSSFSNRRRSTQISCSVCTPICQQIFTFEFMLHAVFWVTKRQTARVNVRTHMDKWKNKNDTGCATIILSLNIYKHPGDVHKNVRCKSPNATENVSYAMSRFRIL